MSTLSELYRDIESHKQRIGLNWRGVQILAHADSFSARLSLDITFSGETVEEALTAMLDALTTCNDATECIAASEKQTRAFSTPREAARKAARAERKRNRREVEVRAKQPAVAAISDEINVLLAGQDNQ